MQISRCLIRAAAQAAQLKFERVAVANCKFRGASYKPAHKPHSSNLNECLTRHAAFEVRHAGLSTGRTAKISMKGSCDMQLSRCVTRVWLQAPQLKTE